MNKMRNKLIRLENEEYNLLEIIFLRKRIKIFWNLASNNGKKILNMINKTPVNQINHKKLANFI